MFPQSDTSITTNIGGKPQTIHVRYIRQDSQNRIKNESQFEDEEDEVQNEESTAAPNSAFQIKTENFDSIVRIKSEIDDYNCETKVKKEEPEDTREFVYFSDTDDDDSDDELQECDCPDCLKDDVICIEASEFTASKEDILIKRLEKANAANDEIAVSDLPQHLSGCQRVLRDRTLNHQEHVDGNEGSGGGGRNRSQPKKVYRCKWEGCKHSASSKQTIFLHIRKRHFKTAPTVVEQKREGKFDPYDCKLVFIEEMVSEPENPLTAFQIDQLEALFLLSQRLDNHQREDISFLLEVCESVIVNWFQVRNSKSFIYNNF